MNKRITSEHLKNSFFVAEENHLQIYFFVLSLLFLKEIFTLNPLTNVQYKMMDSKKVTHSVKKQRSEYWEEYKKSTFESVLAILFQFVDDFLISIKSMKCNFPTGQRKKKPDQDSNQRFLGSNCQCSAN